jgi:Tfp pilus assembly protein PilX
MGLPANHNLPAYPQPFPEKGQNEQRLPRYRGITLLDLLVIEALPVAATQLTTLEASFQGRPPIARHGSPQDIATLAFDIAEAALVEREKRLKPATTPSAAA